MIYEVQNISYAKKNIGLKNVRKNYVKALKRFKLSVVQNNLNTQYVIVFLI